MNSPQLIGLTGQKRSGKSTAAFALSPYYQRLSFAAPIKRMIAAMGVTPEEAENKEAIIERFGHSPRYLWQTLGTEWGRELVTPDIWIHIAEHEAKTILNQGGKVVFDDVRFKNEAEMIHRLGGVVWKLHGPCESTSDTHVSEKGVDLGLVDRFLSNVTTKERFSGDVREAAGIHQLFHEATWT